MKLLIALFKWENKYLLIFIFHKIWGDLYTCKNNSKETAE